MFRRLTTSWRLGRREVPGRAGVRVWEPGSSPPFQGRSRLSNWRWDYSVFRSPKFKACMNPGQILQRHNPLEANKQVSLDTSSGWSQTAGLPAKVKKFLKKMSVNDSQGDRHWNIISLSKPVTTSWVKITVKAVYGTVNNGFKEIQVFGCWKFCQMSIKIKMVIKA